MISIKCTNLLLIFIVAHLLSPVNLHEELPNLKILNYTPVLCLFSIDLTPQMPSFKNFSYV